MIEIVFVPAAKPGTYRAMLGDKQITRATRQPFLDGARALLAMGVGATMPLAGRHEGSAIVAMRSTVGEAAKWSINERDRGGLSKVLWTQRPPSAMGPRTAEEEPTGI